MSPPFFVFPPNLRALEDEYDDSRISVLTSHSLKSLNHSQLDDFVKGVSFDLSDSDVFCVEEQRMFDRVYSLVRGFSLLSTSCKVNFIESLRSNFSVLLPSVDSLARITGSQEQGKEDGEEEEESVVFDRVASYRNAFKIYTYFLLSIVVLEESNCSGNIVKVTGTARKKASLKSWNWDMHRGRILNVIANSLEINLGLLFGSSDPDENYLSFITQ